MPQVDDIERALEGAVEILQTRGWTQQQYTDHFGAVCAIQAIEESCLKLIQKYDRPGHVRNEYAELKWAVMGAIGEAIGDSHRNIVGWNDFTCESVEDVFLGFKKAIQSLHA